MIEVKNLSFTYPGSSSETISDLNFSIAKGEIFGFLGPSGAGKSTTQKVLNGIVSGYRGSACFDGDEISSLNTSFYERIGVVFELPNLYSKFTALENLNFFRALYRGETEDPMTLLEMVGLRDDAYKRVAEFSKGMKMRLNFCRGLLNRPEMLFLDEPTSGLDPVNAKLIKDIIKEKRDSGVTIFLTTHNMFTADELCNRVAFLAQGRISLCDSPRQLKLDHGEKSLSVEWADGANQVKETFSFDEIKSSDRLIDILKNEPIETVHTNEATLEDIFIKTTGEVLV